MSIQLGENFWILVILMSLELFLIVIPVFISAKLGKKPLKKEFKEIGFFREAKSTFRTCLKIILGIDIGIFLYLFSGFLMFLYRDILIESIFGTKFVEEGITNIINTEPIQPSFFEISILIILQILIIGPCEEGFFRGFVIQKLNYKLKLIYSIILSSTFFTLYHVPPFLVPIQTIITYYGYFFTIGSLFALTFIYSGRSLIMCSIAHSIFNILVLIL
ncbi:MAG: lysostaphin resistance A-like protein [Candidatus Hermodarchaeota archaeon]